MILFEELLREVRLRGLITAYHGSPTRFAAFDSNFLGSKSGRTPSNMLGFFFTDNVRIARSFGKYVRQVTLKLERPYILDAKGKDYGAYKDMINDVSDKIRNTNKYDSLIIKNYVDSGIYDKEAFGDDDGFIPKSTQYVPMSTSQISNIKLVSKT